MITNNQVVTSFLGSSPISHFDCCHCITIPVDGVLPASISDLYADLYRDYLPAKTSKRSNQFLCGRYAAHLALSQCSSAVSSHPITRGNHGEPLFPVEFVGSISHTVQFATAVAASSRDIFAVGIDIENTDRCISPRLLKRIANPSDIYWADAAALEPRNNELEERESLQIQFGDQRTIELFSMKESIYKAYFTTHFNTHFNSSSQYQQKVIAFKDIYIYPTNLPNYFHATIASNTGANLRRLPDSHRIFVVFCNTVNNLTTSIAIIPRHS